MIQSPSPSRRPTRYFAPSTQSNAVQKSKRIRNTLTSRPRWKINPCPSSSHPRLPRPTSSSSPRFQFQSSFEPKIHYPSPETHNQQPSRPLQCCQPPTSTYRPCLLLLYTCPLELSFHIFYPRLRQHPRPSPQFRRQGKLHPNHKSPPSVPRRSLPQRHHPPPRRLGHRRLHRRLRHRRRLHPPRLAPRRLRPRRRRRRSQHPPRRHLRTPSPRHPDLRTPQIRPQHRPRRQRTTRHDPHPPNAGEIRKYNPLWRQKQALVLLTRR